MRKKQTGSLLAQIIGSEDDEVYKLGDFFSPGEAKQAQPESLKKAGVSLWYKVKESRGYEPKDTSVPLGKIINVFDPRQRVSGKQLDITVVVVDAEENVIGSAYFIGFPNVYGKAVAASKINVTPEFRKLGIARSIYDLMKSLGYKVEKSSEQTEDGQAMWKAFDRAESAHGSLLAQILAKTSLPSLKPADVLKQIRLDSFEDLYPGYSRKGADPDACKYPDKGSAVQDAREIIEMFQMMPDPIPVYRMIHVKRESDIRTEERVGDSWAWDQSGALGYAHANGLPQPWVLLEGKVAKKDVYWSQTIELFFLYSDGAGFGSENELRLNGRDVKDIKWQWVDTKGKKTKKAKSDIVDDRFEEEPYRQQYRDALPFQGPWNGYDQMSPIEKVYPAISRVLAELRVKSSYLDKSHQLEDKGAVWTHSKTTKSGQQKRATSGSSDPKYVRARSSEWGWSATSVQSALSRSISDWANDKLQEQISKISIPDSDKNLIYRFLTDPNDPAWVSEKVGSQVHSDGITDKYKITISSDCYLVVDANFPGPWNASEADYMMSSLRYVVFKENPIVVSTLLPSTLSWVLGRTPNPNKYPMLSQVLADIIDERYSDPHGGYRHDSSLPIQDTYGWGWGQGPGEFGNAVENNPMGQGVRRAFAAKGNKSYTFYRGFKDLKPGSIKPFFRRDTDSMMYGPGDYFAMDKQTAEYYAYKHANNFGVVVTFQAPLNLVTLDPTKDFNHEGMDFSYATELNLTPGGQKKLKTKEPMILGQDISKVVQAAGYDGALIEETGPSPMFEDSIILLVKQAPMKILGYSLGSAGGSLPTSLRKLGEFKKYPATGWNQVINDIPPQYVSEIDTALKTPKAKSEVEANAALAMRTLAKATLPEGSDLLDFYYSADAEGWREEQREEGEAEWERMTEEERREEIPRLISHGYSSHFPKNPKTPEDWQEVKDAWLSDYEDNQQEYADTTETFFENARVISNPTLVRFSDHQTPDQVKSEGFEGYGAKNLGLTHHGRPSPNGTLAFAFDKKDLKTPKDWKGMASKYGKYAYEFKVPYAVKAWHNTDGEDQVVFDVETVKDLKVVDLEAKTKEKAVLPKRMKKGEKIPF